MSAQLQGRRDEAGIILAINVLVDGSQPREGTIDPGVMSLPALWMYDAESALDVDDRDLTAAIRRRGR